MRTTIRIKENGQVFDLLKQCSHEQAESIVETMKSDTGYKFYCRDGGTMSGLYIESGLSESQYYYAMGYAWALLK
jgi:hypothetical protein